MLLGRSSNLAGPNFEPGTDCLQFLQTSCRILCVGAGGLGCELLKDLALTGFADIDVIDMDTIDVSNLNRQFLFRMKDVGRSKAEVAAEKVMDRIAGVKVTPHHGRIEDKDLAFYEQFHVIILGLDSLEARRYMNSVACSLLEFEDDGSVDMASVKCLVDGGTEGFKGHCRVIVPGVTPCFDCTLWLFPPQTKFPLCTLAETPRSPAHCIEWAKLIQWEAKRSGEDFEADVEEHMRWVFDQATARAQQFGIQGVTYQLTQGVTKNIIPAIPSTNAIVAAACTLEALKIITDVSKRLDNYMMYAGAESVYTHTASYGRDPDCLECSPTEILRVSPSETLQQVMEKIISHPRLGRALTSPSISCGTINLYMRGVLEETTRGNLLKSIGEQVEGDGAVLLVNDKKLVGPLKVRLRFQSEADPQCEGEMQE